MGSSLLGACCQWGRSCCVNDLHGMQTLQETSIVLCCLCLAWLRLQLITDQHHGHVTALSGCQKLYLIILCAAWRQGCCACRSAGMASSSGQHFTPAFASRTPAPTGHPAPSAAAPPTGSSSTGTALGYAGLGAPAARERYSGSVSFQSSLGRRLAAGSGPEVPQAAAPRVACT